MAKILLKASNVMEFVDQAKANLQVESNMIISPGAKDVLRKNQIKITYGTVGQEEIARGQGDRQEIQARSREENSLAEESGGSSKPESLDQQVKKILRQDFKVNREVDVQKIAKIVLKIIQEREDSL